jgi:hypothetical protein
MQVYNEIIKLVSGLRMKHYQRPGREDAQMDVSKILVDLREERAQIEEAILSLERLARGRGRRRGRPPAWMSEMTAPKRRGRPPGTKNKTAPAAVAAKGAAVA